MITTQMVLKLKRKKIRSWKSDRLTAESCFNLNYYAHRRRL